MDGNLIITVCFSFFIFVGGQHDDDKDLPQEINQFIRVSKSSFDAQFSRGQCPDYFYQVGEECLYFGTDGEKYSWHQTQRVCARRIARLLKQKLSLKVHPDNSKSTIVVRQLILNTPMKTKILEALYREYEELHFAISLPSDYKTLDRCQDGKEDTLPQYCSTPQNRNATCYETQELSSTKICLRENACSKRNLRLACEFTLPGNSEITVSTFRQCPRPLGLKHRLSIWAWLLVAVGGMLLLLLLLGGVLALIRNYKKSLTPATKSMIESNHVTDRRYSHTMKTNRTDSTNEPMLIRAVPANISSNDYLDPQPSRRVGPTTMRVTHDDNYISDV